MAVPHNMEQYLQAILQRIEEGTGCGTKDEREARFFASRHAPKIGVCDGSSQSALREWLRQLRLIECTQAKDSLYRGEVIFQTASGSLYESYRTFVASTPNCTIAAVLAHIQSTYLGEDENDVLLTELKKVKQKQGEDLPQYNLRFERAANIAFPRPTAADQKTMVNLYLRNARKSSTIDRIFQLDPFPTTLAVAMTNTRVFWEQKKRQERIQRESKAEEIANRQEESMDISPTEHTKPTREKKGEPKASAPSALTEKDVIALIKKYASVAKPPPARSSKGSDRQRTDSKQERKCFLCNKPGHLRRNCPVQAMISTMEADGSLPTDQGN